MNNRRIALCDALVHADALLDALRAAGPNEWSTEGMRLATAIKEAVREELADVPVEYARAG